MNKEDLPSDSDESDVDYAPSGDDNNPGSELESDDDVGEDDQAGSGDDGGVPKKGKRKRKQKGGKKRAKRSVNEDEVEKGEEESGEQSTLTEEEEKKKTDDLWSEFLGGTSTASKPTPFATTLPRKPDTPAEVLEPPKELEKENKVTVTKIFEFAGEEVLVTKEVSANSAEARLSVAPPKPSPSAIPGQGRGRGRAPGGLTGLSAVLGQLGKKQKIGTLEKSKLDWDRFKTKEGIEDEIQTHNRGRDGYLERQDFLQRTDVRQFEIEKDLRTTKRSNR